jgi:hypothetical protein
MSVEHPGRSHVILRTIVAVIAAPVLYVMSYHALNAAVYFKVVSYGGTLEKVCNVIYAPLDRYERERYRKENAVPPGWQPP